MSLVVRLSYLWNASNITRFQGLIYKFMKFISYNLGRPRHQIISRLMYDLNAQLLPLHFLSFLSWVWSMFTGTIVDIELSVLTRPLHFLFVQRQEISPLFKTLSTLRNVKIHVKIKSVKLIKSLENKKYQVRKLNNITVHISDAQLNK